MCEMGKGVQAEVGSCVVQYVHQIWHLTCAKWC